MSKKYLLISIGIIVIVVFSICIKCGKNDLPTTSMMDAERILQEYLKSANQWEEEYSLEPTDPVVGEIDNNEVYRFEVRYKENVEEVGSRLINNYAITMDGKTIFCMIPQTISGLFKNEYKQIIMKTENISMVFSLHFIIKN